MFSGLQIENMYTCKTYTFGNSLFYVCKCQKIYSLFVGVFKGLRLDLKVEDTKGVYTESTQAYAELIQLIYSRSP